MMRGKKILAVMLMLAMTVSLFAGITVNAASPIVFDGSETVLFDQYFGGLGSAAGTNDFTFSGTWNFTKYFVQANNGTPSITTKDSYDLSKASGWELETKIECTYNGYIITVPGGYTVTWSHNSDGSPIILKKDGTEVAKSSGLIYLYDHDATWNIRYQEGTWNISAQDGDKQNKVTLTYVDESNPTFNGKFKVAGNNTSKFTVYYMKLTQFAASSVAKHWAFETDFKAGDTVAKWADYGFNLPAATTFGNGTALPGSNCSYSFSPKDNKISGDYEFEWKYKVGNANEYYIRFNYIDSKNFYEVRSKRTADATATPGVPQLVLRKCVAGTYTELDFMDMSTHGFYYNSSTGKLIQTGTYIHNVKVTETTDGLKIVATISKDGSTIAPVVLEATDATPFENDGIIRITQNYNGASSTIYYFKANSLVSASEKATDKPTMYTDVVVDKTFTSTDTATSLANEGFTVPASAAITDESGIASEYSAVTYNASLGDNYNFKARVYRNYNASEIRFDNADSNYYYVKALYGSASNKHVIISRKDLGDSAPLAIFQTSTSTSDTYQYGYCNWSDYEVTVSTDSATGYKTIKLVFSPAAGNTVTLTAEDTNPIKDGMSVNIYGNSAGKVKSFTLKKYGTSWAEEVLNETFTSADTHDSLAALGFSGISGAEITDADGINWLAAKNNRYVYYTNDTAFKGSYSFTFKGWRSDSGDAMIRFAKDGSNYYEFTSPYNKNWTLNKVYNGTTYNLYTSSGAAGYTQSGRNTSFEATVNVTEQADGSLKINILWSTAGALRQNITYVDTLTDTSLVDGVETDNGAPITSGTGCHVYQGWAYAKVYSFKLTKYNSSKWFDTNTNRPMYIGRFFDGAGNGLSKPVNGVVYFNYPTSRLGTYKVIAALYENNEMTAITVLDPEAIYGTNAKLFTVNDAENAKIKVFFVDGEETLNNITEVYELN